MQRSHIGLRRRDRALLADPERNHDVGCLRERRSRLVGDRDGRPSLEAASLQHRHDVPRAAGLGDAEHRRARQPRRAVAVSVEPRRGQPDGQPAIEAEQVLAVARGVVGAAAGGNQQVVDAGTEQLRGPFRGTRAPRPLGRRVPPPARVARFRGEKARRGSFENLTSSVLTQRPLSVIGSQTGKVFNETLAILRVRAAAGSRRERRGTVEVRRPRHSPLWQPRACAPSGSRPAAGAATAAPARLRRSTRTRT